MSRREPSVRQRGAGDRRLAGRPAVLLPGLLDGAQQLQGGAGRQHQPAPVLQPHAGPVQGSHRDDPGVAVVPGSVLELDDDRAREHDRRAGARHSRRPTPWRSSRSPSGATCCFSSSPPSSCRVVASILPLWIIARDLDLLNTRLVLMILYTAMNLPLADLDAAVVLPGDPQGADRGGRDRRRRPPGQLTTVILPIAVPGIAATALLCLIFAWNEYFYAVQLNPVSGSTIPIWVTTNISTRGDFLAKLSAASVLASPARRDLRLAGPEADDPWPGDGRHQVSRHVCHRVSQQVSHRMRQQV